MHLHTLITLYNGMLYELSANKPKHLYNKDMTWQPVKSMICKSNHFIHKLKMTSFEHAVI